MQDEHRPGDMHHELGVLGKDNWPGGVLIYLGGAYFPSPVLLCTRPCSQYSGHNTCLILLTLCSAISVPVFTAEDDSGGSRIQTQAVWP